MENNKNLIFWGGVVIAGVGLILYSYFSRPVLQIGQPTSPEVLQSPTSTPTYKSSTTEPFLGLNGIKAPATCQVGGEVDFSDRSTFFSKGSKFSWQNIDSQGRLINWHISPQDNLAIGPNIFGNLTIPSGTDDNLTIRLPENPTSKTYLLTASVTYGQIIKEDVKIKEVSCTGQVKVNLNF